MKTNLNMASKKLVSRRNFIQQSTYAAVGSIGVPTIISSSKIFDEEIILGHGDYQYKLDKSWAKIGTSRNPLLNCHEMVMARDGKLYMIGDHVANNVMVFDKSGKLLDYWGTQFPGGHGLTLSSEGEEDFLLLTDAGWNMNRRGEMKKDNGRVTKTNLDGQVIFDIGHPQTIGVYKPDDSFCPTEVAIGPNGDIYVADGYGEDYILHYDNQGRFIRKWGGHDNEDKTQNLHNAHGITLDNRDPDNPLLVCSSRSENMFKWFTLEGEFVRSLELPNMYPCRAVIDDHNLYAGVCWSIPEGETVFDWTAHTGFMTILEGDKVVSNPGGTKPQYIADKLQASYQLQSKPIWHGHDVCIDEDKNLYVCQWNAGGSAPLKLERV